MRDIHGKIKMHGLANIGMQMERKISKNTKSQIFYDVYFGVGLERTQILMYQIFDGIMMSDCFME